MKNDDGFTFIETLAVLAITIVLSAGIGLSAVKYIDRAKKIATRNQIEIYKVALQTYYLDCGVFPTELQGLEALWQKPELYPISDSWNGPYVDKQITCDSWGNQFLYFANSSTGLAFEICSLGADGKNGGVGNDEDIFSWQ